jgi:hypothetical protein
MQVLTGQMSASVMAISSLPEIFQIPWIFTGIFLSTADSRLWISKLGTPSSVRNLNIAPLHISYFIIFVSDRNNQTLKLTPPPPYVRFVRRTISVQKRSSDIRCTSLVQLRKNTLQFYAANRNPIFSTVSRICFLSMLYISWFCSFGDVASIYW